MSLPSSDELVQQQLATIPTRQSLVGTFVSQSGALAVVNQGDTQLQVKSAATDLIPGDPVRLERRNGDLVVIGPSRTRSRVGKVTATGSLLTVEYPVGSGVTAQIQPLSGYTAAVNDIVLIDWGSAGIVVGKVSTAPAVTTPATPAAPVSKTFDVTFTAKDSGSYQPGYGWRTNDVWSSASNQGCWFYGTKIKDTIPDTANILTAKLYLPLQEQLGTAPLGRHAYAAQPGGAPTISSSSNLSNRSGWVSIPTALVDWLKANTGGLGFDLGGKNIWRGTQKDGQSGALRVTYQA